MIMICLLHMIILIIVILKIIMILKFLIIIVCHYDYGYLCDYDDYYKSWQIIMVIIVILMIWPTQFIMIFLWQIVKKIIFLGQLIMIIIVSLRICPILSLCIMDQLDSDVSWVLSLKSGWSAPDEKF